MNAKMLILSVGNTALYFVTCALIGTGLLLELRMDEEDGNVRLLGMGQDDWGEIHLIIALGFVALAVLHLALHWAWIRSMLARAKWASSLLLAGLILIAGLLLWPANQAGPNGGQSEYHERDDN
jgi:cytochrome bd-type quinol oxidase subunit 2